MSSLEQSAGLDAEHRHATSGCLRQMAAVRVRLGVGMGRWTRQTGLGGELGGENCREMMDG